MASLFILPMLMAHLLLVQCIRYDALELPTEAVAHEFLDIHDRHIVFATEPVAFLAYLRTAKVATVPSWHLLSCAVILPKAIFEERLRQMDFRKFSICIHAYCDGRTEQSLRVDDMQQRNLLLPDFNHRVIESPNELILLDMLGVGTKKRPASHDDRRHS